MWLVFIPIVIVCYAASPGPRCETHVAPLAYVREQDCAAELTRMVQTIPNRRLLIAIGGKCVVRGLGLVL